MKKIFILLLIIPILGFTQNDLVFNKVRNISLSDGQTATVPTGKAWKVESSYPPIIYLIHNGDDDFGTAQSGSTIFAGITSANNQVGGNAVWIKQGNTINASIGAQSFSILEFNVVAASSSTGGSTGTTGDSTISDDGYSNNSSGSGSSNTYDGNNTNFSTPGDDFTDSDGNTYSTTVVDGLVWTTSNANHSTYRDGTPIPHITGWVEWVEATTGAWTYYQQNGSLGYGKIYNYFAIQGKHDNDINTENKIFAPEGWRVPSYTDWTNILYMFRIPPSTDYQTTGKALKSTINWTGLNGNNNSGLNVKPYGFIQGNYYNINSEQFTNGQYNNGNTLATDTKTIFWSSTELVGSIYQSHHLSVTNANYSASLNYANGHYGYSNNDGNYIRLVKDAN